jgi:hypothetical protein
MKILEMLPQLDADALATVHANATRLADQGSPKQKAQAGDVLPLIEAEQARRVAEGQPKTKPKPKPKAKAAPVKVKSKSRRAPVVEDDVPADDDEMV